MEYAFVAEIIGGGEGPFVAQSFIFFREPPTNRYDANNRLTFKDLSDNSNSQDIWPDLKFPDTTYNTFTRSNSTGLM